MLNKKERNLLTKILEEIVEIGHLIKITEQNIVQSL